MKSIASKEPVAQMVQALQTVLCEVPTALEEWSGLVKRHRKISGANLVQTLVLGWLRNPQAGEDELAQQAAELGLEITGPGLAKRWTQNTALFLREVLEVALGQVVLADPVSIPLLERFSAVCLEDSTTIALPAELAEWYQGNGGKASPAACKIFVRLDMLRGQLTASPLQAGRRADGNSPLKHLPGGARTLHIRDKGFTNTRRWGEEAQREEWELTYLRSDVRVYDEEGTLLDLRERLPSLGERGTIRVLVGPQRVPMRLFFERVSPEVAHHRRKKLQIENNERGQTLSERVSALAAWSIAVSTVPEDLLCWEEAVVLLRLRWQIELLFKLWKDHGKLDLWRTTNPDRILCEVCAKLLGLLIQHWILIVSCWQDPHRSLVKAAKAFRQQIALLATALAGDWTLTEAVERILKVVKASAPMTWRGDAPSTSQLLLAGKNQWSSKPLRPWKPFRKKRLWKPDNRPRCQTS